MVTLDKQHGNTLEICTTSPLSNLIIAVKKIELEKVSLSDM